ncbi:MAG: hypothetical protein PHD83_05555 [Caldisericia bacterium]|nr:hypothetical protein [Caldisericia bacterium]
MNEAKTNLAVTEEKKLRRMRIGATISVIISLILLIGSIAFQTYWNVFRFRFVKDGCAVVVDNQFAVGVEKIIRGEEANQIFLEKNAGYREIEKGNEVVLVKIKMKNITPWNAAPRYMEFNLYTKEVNNDYDWASDLLYGVVKPPEGEYKILDTSKVFKPGETRDGVFYFEVEKEKPLLRVDVRSYYRWHNHKSIFLSKYLLDKTGIIVLLTALISLLYWLIIYTLLRNRRNKRSGSSNGIFYYYISIGSTFLYFSYFVAQIKLTDPIWFLIAYFILIIFLLFYPYLRLQRYLFLFYWLKKEDLVLMTSKFKNRVSWDVSEMKETNSPKKVYDFILDTRYYDAIEIHNERTKETFTFTTKVVKVKKPVSEIKNIKAVIRELYNETELDWLGYYRDIFRFSFFYIIIFILYSYFMSIIP